MVEEMVNKSGNTEAEEPEKQELRVNVEGATETAHLPVKLTSEELAAYSRELANSVADVAELEKKKSDVAKDFASQISAKDARIQVLSRRIQTSEEYRDVECQWILNFTEDKKQLMRKDIGEIVKSKPLTDADRQIGIPTEEENADGKEEESE